MGIVRIMLRIAGFCTISFFLGGCASDVEQIPDEDKVQSLVDEVVPVSTFTELPFDLSEADWTFAGQSAFSYIERKWDTEKERMDAGLYCWDEKNNSLKLSEVKTGNEDVIGFGFTDREENIYTFGYVTIEGVFHYYLRKCDSNGVNISEVWLKKDALSTVEGASLIGGAVDKDGRICLYDRFGSLYFFNNQVEFLSKINSTKQGTIMNEFDSRVDLISTGSGEVYGYYFTKDNRFSDNLVYFKVNMKQRTISEEITFLPENNFAVKKLWKGSSESVLYTDENTLWELRLDSSIAEPVLALDSEYVNIEGSYIKAVSPPHRETVFIYSYNPQTRLSESAAITNQKKAALPEKETVTIGMSKDDFSNVLVQYVKQFNRQSQVWYVQVVDYFSYEEKRENYLNDYVLNIMKGKAPDILDVKAIPFEIVEDKGILENLEPFFSESEKIRQEDMLPSVWRSGCLNGEMTQIMPWFRLESCAVQKEKLNERPWNLETFMWLMENYPDMDMLNYMTSMKRQKMLEFAMEANSEIFYDVQKKECYFTGDIFKELLSQIKKLEDDKAEAGKIITEYSSGIDTFMAGEILAVENFIHDMDTFLYMQRNLAEAAQWAGYPSERGEYHKFNPEVLLGINSKSDKKEGAWAFLEYILSEEIQNRIRKSKVSFSVRSKVFEQSLKDARLVVDGFTLVYATEEECRQFSHMVDNAYLKHNRIFDPVSNIVQEESQYYFSDEKSLEEVTEIIQNRVMLYLAE